MIKNIIFICLTALISLSLQACIAMDDSKISVGRKNFIEGDYHRAFRYLEPAAKNGNADSQYAVGYMYFYGLGVAQNKERAFIWMQRAANQGQIQAQQALTALRGEDFTTMQAVPTLSEPTAMAPLTKNHKNLSKNIIQEPIPEQEGIAYPISDPVVSRAPISRPPVGAPVSSNEVARPAIAQNAKGPYTLQLMAAQKQSLLEDFILKNHLDNAKIVKTERGGKEWYALVYGEYADKTLAENSVKNLPQAVQRQQPWVRSLASVSGMKAVG